MTFRSDATEGVWSPTQNVAVQTEANVVAFFFFHQCGFYDPTHHIRGCQKIIWNFALKGRALLLYYIRLVAFCYLSNITTSSDLSAAAPHAHYNTEKHRFQDL